MGCLEAILGDYSARRAPTGLLYAEIHRSVTILPLTPAAQAAAAAAAARPAVPSPSDTMLPTCRGVCGQLPSEERPFLDAFCSYGPHCSAPQSLFVDADNIVELQSI